jgi:hypothetical protein
VCAAHDLVRQPPHCVPAAGLAAAAAAVAAVAALQLLPARWLQVPCWWLLHGCYYCLLLLLLLLLCGPSSTGQAGQQLQEAESNTYVSQVNSLPHSRWTTHHLQLQEA